MVRLRSLQRQERIISLLNRQKTASVQELADELQVSEWTVRRDLDQLEEQEAVRRYHGGARLSRSMCTHLAQEELVAAIDTEHTARAKERIGRAATRFIHPGQHIALGAGTTTTEVARALKGCGKRLVIVTNGLNIALELAPDPTIQVTCTGGDVHGDYSTLTGPVAERALKSHFYDVAIIGVSGIAQEGLTVTSQLNAVPLDVMIQHAHTVIVVADQTKIGVVRFVSLAPLHAVNFLITDAVPSPAFQEQLKAADVGLIVASED